MMILDGDVVDQVDLHMFGLMTHSTYCPICSVFQLPWQNLIVSQSERCNSWAAYRSSKAGNAVNSPPTHLVSTDSKTVTRCRGDDDRGDKIPHSTHNLKDLAGLPMSSSVQLPTPVLAKSSFHISHHWPEFLPEQWPIDQVS